MKRWEYAKPWKLTALLLNQICAVVLVLSVVICTVYVSGSGLGFVGKDQSFESTGYYQNEVQEQIYRCIRAASRESKFEKNGVYDGKTLVNIEQYAEDNTIGSEDTKDGGLYYELSDLLNWSLDGMETGTLMKITYDDGTVGYLSKGFTDYTEQSLYNGDGTEVASISSTENETVVEAPSTDLVESFSEGEGDTQNSVTDTEESTSDTGEDSVPAYWNELITEDEESPFSAMQGTVRNVEQLEAVEERYAPIGYDSITAYAEKKKLTTEKLQEIYYDLENTLPFIYNDYYAYTENLELFSPSMTNMRYFVIPKSVEQISQEDFTKKIYTNMKSFGKVEFSSPKELLDYIRTYKDYLIYDSSDMSYESNNMPISLSELSSYIKGYPPSVEGDYILAVAVDPEYKASDKLAQYKKQYEEIAPVSRVATYGVILGALLYLLTMVYLTLAAGRSTDEDGAITLNRFDRIRSEVAALSLMIPAGIILIAASIGVSLRNMEMMEMVLMGGGIAFVLNLLFQIGYISLVRRIKARTLWKNSILYLICSVFGEMMKNRKVTTKAFLSYVGFLVMNLVLLLMGMKTFLGVILLVGFDIGVGIFLLRQAVQRQQILDGIQKISEGELTAQIPTEQLSGNNLTFAEAVNQMGSGLTTAVEKSVRDERLKSDLITNVSHDIKTPLTSIINYVDLLKREDIQNERAKNYIAILEDKSMRLKHLTDDLVEASKISSGNVKLELTRLNFQELIQQTNGEFSEKFAEKGLQLKVNLPEEPVVIVADGRRLWRVIENLYNNTAKYAMPNTRVYVELTTVGHMVRFSIKNISEQPLNINADELTERFIRGDVARSTEGSGLGLSIARNLTELQKGSFNIYLDGDLFKVTIIFPEADSTPEKDNESQKQDQE